MPGQEMEEVEETCPCTHGAHSPTERRAGGGTGAGTGSYGRTEAKHKGGQESPCGGRKSQTRLKGVLTATGHNHHDHHVHVFSWWIAESLSRSCPQSELPRAQPLPRGSCIQ